MPLLAILLTLSLSVLAPPYKFRPKEKTIEHGIHKAAREGNLQGVQEYVGISAYNLNVQDTYGYTPLHHALVKKRSLIVDFLVSVGANINIPETIHGSTSIFIAIEQKNLQSVQQLLCAGADLRIQSKNHGFPIDYAIKYQAPKEVISHLIIFGGATTANPAYHKENNLRKWLISEYFHYEPNAPSTPTAQELYTFIDNWYKDLKLRKVIPILRATTDTVEQAIEIRAIAEKKRECETCTIL